MKILTLRQGSPEWLEHRRTKFNASDAPAMLGESPYCTRGELLRRMHTGLAPEVDSATQRRFDAGHQVEELLRKVAEQIVGEPLHPFVGVADFDERMSASFDGCTFVGDETAECKLLNARLRAAFADMESIAPEHGERSAAKCLPIDYRVQMEQQARIAGATRVLFLAGELRDDGTLGDTLSCWYYPDDALWQRIRGGWEQFATDLAAYTPPAASAVEKIVAEPVEALPAPMVQVSGQLTLTDNFAVFEKRLRAFLDTELIREPKTDEDFATLDVQIKAMKGAEAALDSAEAQMLAQIQSVDQAKRTKDMLAELVRKNRLLAERLLKEEKERRRGEIVAGGIGALKAHIEALNTRLGKPHMPAIPADFGGAIRGLKTLASMEDKVATELARAKIAANEVADRIQANLATLREKAAEVPHLFPDTATIVLKAPEDLQALVAARIAEHRAAEERRLEQERARIRAEEEARARAQAQREQQEREAAERRQREEAEAAQRQQEQEAMREQSMAGLGVAQPAPVATVHPLPTRAPAAAPSAPTLRLGEISSRLGFTVTADFLASIGFPVVATDKAAKLWHEHQFPGICAAIAEHVVAVANRQKAA
jgi:predicted phage-related endonuclease